MTTLESSNTHMDTEEEEQQRDQIIEQLELLNKKMTQQNSVRHNFMKGIIYGVGFFIGSVVIATILLGLLSPWFGQIDFVRNNFERGTSLK